MNFGPHDPIQIYITAPSVNYIAISSSGKINVNGTWTGGSVSTSIDGSGDVVIGNIMADNFASNHQRVRECPGKWRSREL